MGSTWANQAGFAMCKEWISPTVADCLIHSTSKQRSTYEQQLIPSSTTTMLIIPAVLPSYPLEHKEDDCQLCYNGTPCSKYVYAFMYVYDVHVIYFIYVYSYLSNTTTSYCNKDKTKYWTYYSWLCNLLLQQLFKCKINIYYCFSFLTVTDIIYPLVNNFFQPTLLHSLYLVE